MVQMKLNTAQQGKAIIIGFISHMVQMKPAKTWSGETTTS